MVTPKLRRLRSSLTGFHRDERGQTGIFFVLSLLFVSMLLALGLDAGLYYFGHRWSQNEAEAAALAAAQFLPSDDLTKASAAASSSLTQNGVDPTHTNCNDAGRIGQYWSRFAGPSPDTVRVCVRREIRSVFAGMFGVPAVYVSATAVASAAPADVAYSMPWAVVPPDPNCYPAGWTAPSYLPSPHTPPCNGDLNGDGDYTDPGECQGDFVTCPWGLNLDRLYVFKESGGGNTGAIDSCTTGASGYEECIAGSAIADNFFTVGQQITVPVKSGNMANATTGGLNTRYASENHAACDVNATPNPQNGHDPDGKVRARSRLYDAPQSAECPLRFVLVPVLYDWDEPTGFPPNGNGTFTVLGVATFGVANWKRSVGGNNTPTGNNTSPDPSAAVACATGSDAHDPDGNPNNSPVFFPGLEFDCGVVWGYLFGDIQPPSVLIQRIGNSGNPIAPILVVLTD